MGMRGADQNIRCRNAGSLFDPLPGGIAQIIRDEKDIVADQDQLRFPVRQIDRRTPERIMHPGAVSLHMRVATEELRVLRRNLNLRRSGHQTCLILFHAS